MIFWKINVIFVEVNNNSDKGLVVIGCKSVQHLPVMNLILALKGHNKLNLNEGLLKVDTFFSKIFIFTDHNQMCLYFQYFYKKLP